VPAWADLSWLGPPERAALLLSLRVSLAATLFSLPLGVLVAYALARWRFPGRGLLNVLVHLPLVLPPVVTGYALLRLFGRRGPVGDSWRSAAASCWRSAGRARRSPPP
jgi:molybdate transport system permease protein